MTSLTQGLAAQLAGALVLARLWLQPERDWINNVEAKETERPAMLFGGSGAPETTTPGGIKAKVPAGSDHADKICAVCQEKLEIAWDDEADEWMYNDAVLCDDGEIIHAECANK